MLAWLGPAADGSNRAIRALKAATRLRPFPEEEQEAVLALFNRPYWRRMWIVPEILLAKVVTVLCGPSLAPWPCFEDAALYLPYIFATSGRERAQEMHQLTELKRKFDASRRSKGPSYKELTLIALINACRKRECDDTRDRIFALLAVAPPENWTEISYTFPAHRVHNTVLRAMYSPHSALKEDIERTHRIVCEALELPNDGEDLLGAAFPRYELRTPVPRGSIPHDVDM